MAAPEPVSPSRVSVAVVGFGRFGSLFADLLQTVPALDVAVTGRTDRSAEARAAGLRWLPLSAALGRDVVVFSVPMRDLGPALRLAAPALRPGALVLDVCSVKVLPARLMADLLPANVGVLATHPMFGPDGVRQFGVRGQRIVTCPVRLDGERLAEVEGWFRTLGLQVLRMTPDEHDRQAAVSQGLVHFIGRSIERLGLAEPVVTTNNAHRLFELAASVAADSEALFVDLETMNPHAAGVRRAFLDAAGELDRRLTEAEGPSARSADCLRAGDR
ncbi:MAG: prephenate dehydrogenase [Chloroflexi bacterium]|nr:prephenate dehydrogenase [Chloroflexota bacterium]